MLKSHCRKEGLAWTLRDVAAYGLALGKTVRRGQDYRRGAG